MKVLYTVVVLSLLQWPSCTVLSSELPDIRDLLEQWNSHNAVKGSRARVSAKNTYRECKDIPYNCGSYKHLCEEKPKMMETLCRKTCGFCSEGDCPSLGGVNVGGQCLSFNTERKTWDQAVSSCTAKNQRLASLRDPVAANAYLKRHHGGKRFWLGGSDKTHEGAWIWLDGKTFVGFPWPPGVPKNENRKENCLEWGWKNNYNDQTCTMTLGYICEPKRDCPSLGGVNVAGQCLSFNTELKTWDQAVSSCTAKNQQLASLRDPAAANAYLKRHHGGKRFWLGGSDKTHEGAWIWLDGKTFVGFPWPPGVPKNENRKENCLEWGWMNNYNDQTCTMTLGYICEYI